MQSSNKSITAMYNDEDNNDAYDDAYDHYMHTGELSEYFEDDCDDNRVDSSPSHLQNPNPGNAAQSGGCLTVLAAMLLVGLAIIGVL